MTRNAKGAILMMISSFITGWTISFATTHTNLPVGAQCAQWQITLAAIIAMIGAILFLFGGALAISKTEGSDDKE